MGKEERGVPEAAPLSGAAGDEPAIGQYLARQRRLRGISLEDLSARTKIPIRSLERLEGGAFDRAPDGFARGFVRAVAAALGLDVDETVLRLLNEPPEDEARERRDGARRGLLALAAVGLLLAVLIGGVVWGLRALLGPDEGSPAPVEGLIYRRDPVRALADGVGVERGAEAEEGAGDR